MPSCPLLVEAAAADNNNTDAFVAQFGAAALFDPDDPFVMVKGEYKYLPVLCIPVIVPVFRSTSDHRRPLRSAVQMTELLSPTTRSMVTARITAPKR